MEVLNAVIKLSETNREVRNLSLRDRSTEVNTAMLCQPWILCQNYGKTTTKRAEYRSIAKVPIDYRKTGGP